MIGSSRRRLTALGVAAAVCTCAWAMASFGQESPPGEPRWTLQPTDYDIRAWYPSAADRRHQVGRATIGCRSNSNGELTDCRVRDESPARAGFGAAAIQLSKNFWVETDGKGADWKGRTVSASVDFTPKDYVRVMSAGPAADPSAGPALARLVSGTFGARYPYQARFTGLSGRVVLHCRIGRDGAAPDCAAVDEQPRGHGFGLAAEQGARHVRVAGKTLDGLPTEGMVLEKVVIVGPSCSDLPAWDSTLSGCRTGSSRARPDGGPLQ